jgi:hypothetical protein
MRETKKVCFKCVRVQKNSASINNAAENPTNNYHITDAFFLIIRELDFSFVKLQFIFNEYFCLM